MSGTREDITADALDWINGELVQIFGDAARAIEQCEHEADAVLQAARQRARRIAGRTDERITLINQRTRQRLQQQLAEAERQARRAERERAHDGRTARVDEVVARLAARLTGGTDVD